MKSNTSKEEIALRYQQLNPNVQSMLTDYYNLWLGLRLVADGNDNQREYGLASITAQIKEGREPFGQPVIYDRIIKEMNESLERKDDKYTEKDRTHLSELEELVNYANTSAKENKLYRETAKDIYSTLLVFLYGQEK